MGLKNLFRRSKAEPAEAVDDGPAPGHASQPSQSPDSRADVDARLEEAQQQHRAGRVGEADIVYREILLSDPYHAGAQHMIGVVFLQRGKPLEAEQCFRLAIEQDGGQADFHSNLGNALTAQDRIAEALDCFKGAIELDPCHVAALSNASTASVALGRTSEAKRYCELLIEVAPGDSDARLNLAAAHIEAHETLEAVAVLREGLEIEPENAALQLQLASALELLNQLDEASGIVERLEAEQPGSARVSLLAGVIARRQGDTERAEDRLSAALEQGLSEQESVEAYNQLGLALDAQGQAEAAFSAFDRSNQALARVVGSRSGDGDRFLQEVDALGRYFSAEKLAELADRFGATTDDEPVFFVGFPRSGTTLMEQVLKAHPALATTDERSPLVAVLRQIDETHGNYPQSLERMTVAEFDGLRRHFLDFCRDELGMPAGRRVVDKLPLNIVHCGLAKLLFPHARFVVALRDPRDACFSCFMQKFEINSAMANFLELESTGRTYAAVMGLWLHYRPLLGDHWIEYRYEDLVDDFEGTVTRVLDFLGAGWHDDVRRYREAAQQRVIATPSYRDVAEPVNRRAVARWRRYEPQLAPVFPHLQPFIETFGYGE